MAVAVALAIGFSLSACAEEPSAPPPRPASPSTTPSPQPSASPKPKLGLLPSGTATQNFDYFNAVATDALELEAAADGRTYIDALVAGGFDRNAMQVTFDRTQADLAADAIMFSVNFGDECLIGQVGPATDGFHSMVAPVLSTGLCLVGSTRQIDW